LVLSHVEDSRELAAIAMMQDAYPQHHNLRHFLSRDMWYGNQSVLHCVMRCCIANACLLVMGFLAERVPGFLDSTVDSYDYMQTAVRNNHGVECLDFLARHGVSARQAEDDLHEPRQTSFLVSCVYARKYHKMVFLLQRGADPLYHRAARDSFNVFLNFIMMKPPVHEQPMFAACLQEMALAISRSLGPNFVLHEDTWGGRDGKHNPFAVADNAFVMQKLVELGCNVHTVSRNGANATFIAAEHTNAESIVFLRDHHVDFSVVADGGYTPITHILYLQELGETCQHAIDRVNLLCECGVDICQATHTGQDALSMAVAISLSQPDSIALADAIRERVVAARRFPEL